jgi:hypothetical protein
VRFADLDLALIDRHTKKLRRVMAARPGRHEAKPEPTKETVGDLSGS